MKQYLKLCRVSHYIKNGLIFVPLIFAKRWLTLDIISVLYGFIAFCFISSVVYIINDIKDVKKDRLHPIKCNRPLASGKIKINVAIILAIILFLLSLGFNYLAAGNHLQVLALLLLYFLINVFYSIGLKNVVLIDILILVTGYIIRIYYGALIINVNVSDWLYLTIMSAAFFMAFGKRRNEIIKVNTKSRKVLELYNKDFLDRNMYVCLALTITFYSLWTISQEIKYLILTIPVVIIIFLKYTLIIENDSHGDPTDIVLKDKAIQILGGVLGLFMLYLMR